MPAPATALPRRSPSRPPCRPSRLRGILLLALALGALPDVARAQDGPRRIRPGEVAHGRIDTPGGHQDWIVVSEDGRILTMQVDAAAFPAGFRFGTWEQGGFGRQIGWTADTNGSGYARLIRTPAAGREYVIRVAAHDVTATGPYTLRVQAGIPTPEIRAGRSAVGEINWNDARTSRGALYHETFYDDWAFTPETADPVWIRLQAVWHPPLLQVGTMDGGRFTVLAEAARDSVDAVLPLEPEPGRRYVIRVDGSWYHSSPGTGPYVLHVQRTPPRVSKVIQPGESVESALYPPVIILDEWELTPPAGETLTLRVEGAGFQPELGISTWEGGPWRTLGQDGGGRDGTSAVLVFTPVAGRKYIVRVSNPERGGAYTLRIERGGDPARAVADPPVPAP